MGYYAFEGMNGCGKSSLSRMFTEYLISKEGAENVVTTFEPGKTEFGKNIREVLLFGSHKISPDTILMMMTADRIENMNNIVIPALEAGKSVVTDRSYMSSVVFQQISDLFTIEDIVSLSRKIMRGYEPTWFTVIADLETLSKRLGSREEQENFEKAQHAQQSLYQERYIKASCRLGGHIIDNNGTLQESLDQIIAIADQKRSSELSS